MTEELESLKRVIERLNKGRFEYYLTGSMAMSFYLVARMTRDSDIIIQLNENDAKRFYDLFNDEFYMDFEMLMDSINKKMMFNLLDKKSFFKFDFIFFENTEYEVEKFKRRAAKKINNTEIYVISPEDLVISKLEWARNSLSEMQIKDVGMLLKLDIDKKYINFWINKLNLIEVYKRI